MRHLMVLFSVALLAITVRAQNVDDVMKLAQAGVSESVMLAFVQSNADFDLTAEDITRLKASKVPDSVVVAMLKSPKAANRMVENREPAPAAEPVRERVITRERVVEQPAATYVYDSVPSVTYVSGGYYPYYPRYYGGYYGSYYGGCYPRYYGGCYSPRYYGCYSYPRYGGYYGGGYRSGGYVSGFYSSGGHSRVGVGFGARF